MNIGIDLDGVVFNSEMLFDVYSEIFDCDELKKNSIIDINEPRVQGKYNWSKEEEDKYLDKYINLSNFDIMPGAKEVIDKLKEYGCKFICITARGLVRDPIPNIEVAKRKLEEYDITFDKISWEVRDKLDMCIKEKIDIMIEDNYHHCEKISKKGIKCIYFHMSGKKELKNTNFIRQVNNWGEIYRLITQENF